MPDIYKIYRTPFPFLPKLSRSVLPSNRYRRLCSAMSAASACVLVAGQVEDAKRFVQAFGTQAIFTVRFVSQDKKHGERFRSMSTGGGGL